MVEVSEERRAEVMEAYRTVGVEAIDIGKVTGDGQVCLRVPGISRDSSRFFLSEMETLRQGLNQPIRGGRNFGLRTGMITASRRALFCAVVVHAGDRMYDCSKRLIT